MCIGARLTVLGQERAYAHTVPSSFSPLSRPSPSIAIHPSRYNRVTCFNLE